MKRTIGMSNSKENLWTIEDAAEYCQVKASVIRYWLQNTNIPFIKLGKNIRFDPEDFKSWVNQHKNTNGFFIEDELRLIT